MNLDIWLGYFFTCLIKWLLLVFFPCFVLLVFFPPTVRVSGLITCLGLMGSIFIYHWLFEISTLLWLELSWLLLMGLILHFPGSKLLEHQGAAGPDLPDCCGYDQGKDARGYPEDIQHCEWLHRRGGGRGSKGESMGIWVKALLFC